MVIFNLIDSTKGLEAVEVTGPEGVPVLGSQYARQTSRRGDSISNNEIQNPRDRVPRNERGPRRSAQNVQDGAESPRRRPRQPRSQSGPRPTNNGRMSNSNNIEDNNGMRRQNRRRGPPMNARNNYAPNPYNTNSYYENDEPLYYTFKPSECFFFQFFFFFF
jgi:hypothetical protein